MEELPLPMLLHLLADCPRLETLHIGEVWSYPLLDLDLTPPLQKVHMPYLRSISTCCTTLQAASHILSSLELPSKTRIRIHNAPVSAHTTADDNRLPSLAFMQPLTRLELAANSTTLYLVAEGDGAGIWIQAKWEGGSPSVWPAWLRQLPETVPLASISTFHVSLADWSVLPGLLSCMPGLSTLGAMTLPDGTGSTHDPMISALQSALQTAGPCPQSPRCPGLSTLSIQCSTTPDVGCVVALMPRDARRLSRLVLDFPGASLPEPFLGKVDEIEFGCGGICGWTKRSGWDVENEYWRLPEEDEPREARYTTAENLVCLSKPFTGTTERLKAAQDGRDRGHWRFPCIAGASAVCVHARFGEWIADVKGVAFPEPQAFTTNSSFAA
ncbi:hypothetical protein GSI_11063 [Ganoderma sinense ZZ0214-1]|uniref:Uncharacterized protein n=1 Tax=Ganoderma sinense ZZ0214-1 TaxID=1077348 RepID=A0A2G8RZD4_9APHY|nr:hypothetical protein GSI_11063 [Ganoderma sinense ZZ0214-1]